jgi:hypothetical protein
MRGVVQVSSRCHRVTSALPATLGRHFTAHFSRMRQLNPHVVCAGVVRVHQRCRRGAVQVSSRCRPVTSALPANLGRHFTAHFSRVRQLNPHVNMQVWSEYIRGVAEVSSRCHPVTSAPFSRVRQLNPHVGCAGVVRSVGVKSPLRHHVIHCVTEVCGVRCRPYRDMT